MWIVRGIGGKLIKRLFRSRVVRKIGFYRGVIVETKLDQHANDRCLLRNKALKLHGIEKNLRKMLIFSRKDLKI